MSFHREQADEVTIKPAPEFTDIGYAGDGRHFDIMGNDGKAGLVQLPQGQGLPIYNNSLTETISDQGQSPLNYSKFYCDYFVAEKIKLQSADIKISGAQKKDFVVLEVLYQYSADPEVWVLGKRFVRRFYLSTDFEDQDTPDLPYAKTLEAGKYIVRLVYYKHEGNTNDVDLRVNYMLHEVTEQ